jgi:hypothetical protein
LDRDSGRRLWSTPIEPQAIQPLQSADLPIIAFACRSNARQPARRYQSLPSILCIDSRNGRTVYNERITDDQFQNLRIVSQPETKSVELHLTRSNVILKFTDKAYPAASPEKKAPITPAADNKK